MWSLPDDISRYAETHTRDESEVLYNLHRETYLGFLLPQMISSKVQGAFLSSVSRMVKPRNILEVGTFTGYSAICLCDGLQEGGVLHTMDANEETAPVSAKAFEAAGLNDRIHFHLGKAAEIIPDVLATGLPFDLVFIDADKYNYSTYYDQVIEHLPKGAWIVADNALWDGKVVQEKKDRETAGIDAYNKKVMADDRVEQVLLPMLDGMMLCQKR